MILMDVHFSVVIDHEVMTSFTIVSFAISCKDILDPIAWFKTVGITFGGAIHYMSILLMDALDTWKYFHVIVIPLITSTKKVTSLNTLFFDCKPQNMNLDILTSSKFTRFR